MAFRHAGPTQRRKLKSERKSRCSARHLFLPFFSSRSAGPGASAQQADVGQDLFEQYCATCHGLSGAGDGPLTVYLTEKVSDLTILAENNDGAFPMLKVIHIIDGRTGLRGHGGPMPTYGDIFEAEERSGMEGDYGPVLAARGRIMSVALYLEQLQK